MVSGGTAKRQEWVPWVIVGGGTFLRVFHCERHGFGFDEVFALNKAWQPSVRAVAEAAIVTEPSLYHFVMHALTGPGWPEWGIRAVSMVCSVGALAVLWRLLAPALPRAVALAALALAACSPFQVMKAQAARPYALCEFLALGAALAAVRAAREPRRRSGWAVAGLLALLAVMTHPLALVWLVAVPMYLFAVAPRSRRRTTVLAAVLAGVPAALLVVAWAAAVRLHIASAVSALPPVPLAVFAAAAGEWFGAGSFVPEVLRWPALLAFGLSAGAGLAAEARFRRPGARLAVVLGLLPLLLLYAGHRAGLIDSPRPRYALEAQVFLLAACARGIWLLPAAWMRAGSLAVLLALEAGSAFRATAGGPPGPGQPFDAPVREAAALIRSEAGSGEAAVSVNFEGFVPLAFYLGGRPPATYTEVDPYFGVPNGYAAPVPLARSAARAKGLWLVIAPVRYFPEIGPHLAAAAELRRAGLVLRDVRPLDGLRIEHWRPAR